MQPILVPSTQPVAGYTASRRLALLAANDKSNTEVLRMTRGIEVVGFKVTVSPDALPGATRTATVDDIDIRVESQDLRLTRDASEDNDVDTFADAAALSLPLRYINAILKGSPDITVQARWKSANHAAVFGNCLVTVSVLYNWEKQ